MMVALFLAGSNTTARGALASYGAENDRMRLSGKRQSERCRMNGRQQPGQRQASAEWSFRASVSPLMQQRRIGSGERCSLRRGEGAVQRHDPASQVVEAHALPSSALNGAGELTLIRPIGDGLG